MKKRINKKIDKKGFTLIEILAVIVILTMLFLIAIPAISRYINQSRSETYEAHEASIEQAMANKMSECVAKSTENCAPDNGKSKRYTLKNLIDEGYSKRIKDPGKDGEFCSETDSYIVVYNSSSNVSEMSYQVCLKCPASGYQSKTCKKGPIHNTCSSEEQDREKPTCTVISSNDAWTNKDVYISVECNDDCGCKQDSYSEKVTESRRTTTITVADNYNKTTQCDPIDTYVDKDKPECKLEVVGTEHNGWYNGSTAPVVKMSTPTDKTSGVLTYGMGTSKSKADYNKEMEYTVKDGITTVYGYVKDRAGNEGQCSVEIKYDSGKPKVQTVDYGYVVYPKNDIASKNGNVITLNNITGEYGSVLGAYVYFKTGVAGQVTFKNGSTELSKITVSAGVKKMKFKFSSAGTYNNITITLANATQLNDVDRIELLTDHTNGFFTNKNVTMYINGSDSISGKAEYKFENGDWSTSNQKTYEGNKSFDMYMRDKAGNVSDKVSRTINNIDKIEPNTPAITRTAYNTFTWSVTDKDGNGTSTKSDMRSYNINMSPTEPTTWSNGSSGTYNQVTTAGTYYVWVMDKAGNVNKNTKNAYTVTRSQGTGTTLTTKFESSNGTAFTNNPVVLHDTPIYVNASSLANYYGIAVKKNNSAISLNATTKITENSTISSVTTACPTTYPNSAAGSATINSCYVTLAAGKFVETAGAGAKNCTANYYCSGGTNIYYDKTGGRTSCPSGYGNSAAGSSAITNCYRNVAKGHYIKNKKDTTDTECACGSAKAAHTVNYNSTSSCDACGSGKHAAKGAESCTSCSTGYEPSSNKCSCVESCQKISVVGHMTYNSSGVNDPCGNHGIQNQNYKCSYTFNDCSTGVFGKTCYYNPAVSSVVYCHYAVKWDESKGKNYSQSNGDGLHCFKDSTEWWYIRSTEGARAVACNKNNKCSHSTCVNGGCSTASGWVASTYCPYDCYTYDDNPTK